MENRTIDLDFCHEHPGIHEQEANQKESGQFYRFLLHWSSILCCVSNELCHHRGHGTLRQASPDPHLEPWHFFFPMVPRFFSASLSCLLILHCFLLSSLNPVFQLHLVPLAFVYSLHTKKLTGPMPMTCNVKDVCGVVVFPNV